MYNYALGHKPLITHIHLGPGAALLIAVGPKERERLAEEERLKREEEQRLREEWEAEHPGEPYPEDSASEETPEEAEATETL